MGFLQTTITETKTSSFTPSAAATIYLIDATAGNLTVTLPVARQHAHSVYEFRRIDATGHTVTIAGATDSTVSPAVADLVNGDASTTLAAGTALCLVSDGAAGWYDLSSNASGGGGGSVSDPLELGTPVWTSNNPLAQHLRVNADPTSGFPALGVGTDDPTYLGAAIQAQSGWAGVWGLSAGNFGAGVLAEGDGDTSYGVLAQVFGAASIGVRIYVSQATAIALQLDGGPMNFFPLAEPPAPTAGCYVYLDSADNHLKKKLPTGPPVDLG